MTLAIDNGKPIRTKDFPSWPQYDEAEEAGLLRSLRQGQWWRVHGKETGLFESEFARYHGCEHAVAVTNGTVGLELALSAMDIKLEDEVIVPAFTFISTSMAVQRLGATPIVVDVLPNTYCIDPAAVEKAITEKTRAIIPVHMAGHFCNMDALLDIADKHTLAVIQDAAHAHGAKGQHAKAVGEWGTLACFSFQNFKLMTAGEGGLVLCPTPELKDKVTLLSNCGRPPLDKEYKHELVGTNARMNEFSSAVLRAQLNRLAHQTEIREHNAALLSERLCDLDALSLQQHTEDAVVHPHYMYMFTLNPAGEKTVDRNHFVECLIAEGIPAFRAYQALYRTACFWQSRIPKTTERELIEACPVTEHIARNGVWIHHRALLGDEQDISDVALAIKKVLAKLLA